MQNGGTWLQGPCLLTGNRDEDDGQDELRELHAGANEGGQEFQAGGRPEGVPVAQLPPGFLVQVALQGLQVVCLPRVLGVVVAQGACQDHGHQARQEDDHHEGVEDGEPVDLRAHTRAQLSQNTKVKNTTQKTIKTQRHQNTYILNKLYVSTKKRGSNCRTCSLPHPHFKGFSGYRNSREKFNQWQTQRR